jgi:hypothetical protein
LRPNIELKTLQNLNIDSFVQALHAVPIASHAHIGKAEAVRAWFDQQHSNAQVVSSHHVRDVSQHIELKLLQISHRDSILKLGILIFE